MSINRVTISGNLTRDADLRSTQGGMAIMGFGVAVNDRRKNQQTGEWEDYPNFVDCTMFGTRAEKLQPYMAKGTKVAIEGKLRYSSWEHEGQRRSKLEVIVDEIEFMSSRQQDAPPAVRAAGVPAAGLRSAGGPSAGLRSAGSATAVRAAGISEPACGPAAAQAGTRTSPAGIRPAGGASARCSGRAAAAQPVRRGDSLLGVTAACKSLTRS